MKIARRGKNDELMPRFHRILEITSSSLRNFITAAEAAGLLVI
jgi:hypothetical protein